MPAESIRILKKYKINITRPRMLMLNAFLEAGHSLDLHYFLHENSVKLERTTVFRTLQLFTRKSLVYKVPADGNYKYLLRENENGQSSEKEHSSFVCVNCGKAVLVTTIAEPRLRIPRGYKIQNLDIIIHGLCPACKS